MFSQSSALVSTKPARTLRKSDKRHLLQSISTALSPSLAAAFPSTDLELRPLTATEPLCSLVVALPSAEAFFVDLSTPTRKNRFMPTVRALVGLADLAGLTVFATTSNVFEFISRGADFMLPGLRADLAALPDFAVDDVVGVSIGGVVVAVGLALMSKQQALAAGGKGKLARLLHWFGDALWLASSRLGHDTIVAALRDEPLPLSDALSSTAESAAAEPAAAPAAPAASPDEVLVASFFRGLAASPDADLPLLTQVLFERMCAHRPPGTTVDVKASSFKKLLPFLKAMEAKEAVKLKETAPGVWAVVEVDRDSTAYAEAAATIELADAVAPVILHSSEAGFIDVLVGRERVPVELPRVVASLATSRWPRMVQLLLVDDALVPLFGGRQLIAADDAAALVAGVVREHTTSVGKNTCTLNATLSAALGDASSSSDAVPKKAVAERVRKQLKACWISVAPDGMPSKLHRGEPTKMLVDEILVRGHKCTAVVGLVPLFGVDIAQVCEAWRQQLASGCTVGEHKCQADAIIVQGLHADAVVQQLREQFSVPESAIAVAKLKGRK